MTTDEQQSDARGHEALLAAAQDDFKLSEEAYGEQRQRELEDLRFEAGEHFGREELAYLKNSGKPDVVMDQTSGQVAKVTNQPVHRMVISPNGGGADPTSAQYWQGICRRIENLSGAEDVYKWARRHAVIMGRGFWRVRNDYFIRMERRADGVYSPEAFQQDIRIEPILHQHSVYEDPLDPSLDFSQPRFYILGSDVGWDQAKRLHKELKGHDARSLRGLPTAQGDCPAAWATEKTVRIAERYWIEEDVFTLCAIQLGDGSVQVVEKTKDTQYPKEIVLKEHTFRIPKVKWMKYVHGIVLETKDVPGYHIPVVKIVGERRVVDGKEDCRGMVRMAKGPQRLVNFYEARLASAVDLGSEGIWLASVRAVGDRQSEYANAHKTKPAVLFWNDLDESGQPIAPPEFVHAAPQVQHLVMAAQRASMALRGVLGVPDVTPEESKPEQSGRAIRARQAEQAQATSHYGDSTKNGVRHTGRIILGMGREVYDTARILRINGKDEKEIELLVSKGGPDDTALKQLGKLRADIEHMLDVGVGEFDVTVTGGKLRDTERQETSEVIRDILPVLPPPLAVKASAALVRQTDGLGELADELAPPDDTNMVPKEQAEAEIQKREQVIQQASQKIDELQKVIDGKVVENETKKAIAKYETDAKVQIEREKGQIERDKALIARDQAIQVARLTPAPQPQASPEFGG